MNIYICPVCGGDVTNDTGITTLNGYFVHDDNNCRILDEETNESTEREIKF